MTGRNDDDRPTVVLLFPEDLRQELREAHERREAEEERRKSAEFARQKRRDKLERELLKWLQGGKGRRVLPTPPPDPVALAVQRKKLLADWLERNPDRRVSHLYKKGHADYCMDGPRFHQWRHGGL